VERHAYQNGNDGMNPEDELSIDDDDMKVTNNFPKFRSRKLLMSIEHVPVKVRCLNSRDVKYYSSCRNQIYFSLLKVVR